MAKYESYLNWRDIADWPLLPFEIVDRLLHPLPKLLRFILIVPCILMAAPFMAVLLVIALPVILWREI